MAVLRLDLDADTFEHLVRSAVAERRPVVMQAEVVLRRALGLPFPYATGDATAAAPPAPPPSGKAIPEDSP